MGKRILIVGGVAGGASAAARLRRLDEFADIVIFERGPHVSFANCGLPYYIGGEIADEKSLLVQNPKRLRDVFNLDVRTRHEVVAIDRSNRKIEVRNLETGQTRRERYDDLILAMGAAPLKPAIPGIDREGHFTLRNIPDTLAIVEWIQSQTAMNAVIVGGGFIGLEMAEQLHELGLKISVVEALPQLLSPLDPEMAAQVQNELINHQVAVHVNEPVVAFEPGENVCASVVVLKSGARIPADVVILGLGVRPETALAKAAGLEIGERGGIRVDVRMRTSDAHIWAVGDAVEVRDPVTGQFTLVPLAGPANRQGRIAADNIAGGNSTYRGTLGTAIVRVFDLVAASTGANEKTLKRLGIPYEVVHLHPNSHAAYYPGAEPMAMKLIFVPGSGKLLGAQIVGKDGVDKRIDVFATALYGQMTVHDLAELELAYAPPFGAAKDPINLAGMAAQNVLSGLVETAQWHDVGKIDALIVDVREKRERDQGLIPNSIHIPLGELRQRLNELPKDRELLVHCQSGQRSYTACRMLMQHGFRCRNLAGSFRTWKATQS